MHTSKDDKVFYVKYVAINLSGSCVYWLYSTSLESSKTIFEFIPSSITISEWTEEN